VPSRLAALGLPDFSRKRGLDYVSQELDRPTKCVLWIAMAFLWNWRQQPGYRTTSLEDRYRLARPLDLVEDGQTLRLELGSSD
jgi:hypothetical protein